MTAFIHRVRVRYGECDSMGFVHHSVYALYFEEARTEIMRSLGISYRELEENGIIMPVRSMQFLFSKAARYDDLLEIRVIFKGAQGVRCVFEYETRNQQDELLNTASTELFFARKTDLKPIKLPVEIDEIFQKL